MQKFCPWWIALAFVVSATAGAQSWPTKPVKLVVPFPAGGGTDAFARPLAAFCRSRLGQQFFIDNRGGAGGTIGADCRKVAAGRLHVPGRRRPPHDRGQRLREAAYSLEKDLVPVTLVSIVPNVVVLHPKVPINSIKELIDYAKANPNKLNFASAGNGTSHHLPPSCSS